MRRILLVVIMIFALFALLYIVVRVMFSPDRLLQTIAAPVDPRSEAADATLAAIGALVAPAITATASARETALALLPGAAGAEWLPGMTAANLTAYLQAHTLTCNTPSTASELISWTCRRSAPEAEYVVNFYGKDAAHIRSGTATVLQRGAASSQITQNFFSELAGIPYAGSTPDRMRDWIQRTLAAAPDRNAIHGETAIGSGKFAISGLAANRALQFGALSVQWQ